MRNIYFILLSLLILSCKEQRRSEENEPTSKNEWFINQRMFPYDKPDYTAYKNSVQWMRNEYQKISNSSLRSSSLQSWVYSGPENLGGRVVDVEMNPASFNTMYACAASGGIFKTTDAGNSWTPIFDNNPSLSIGDLAIAPSDTNILYCGTGEANAGGGSLCYDGAGVFKSTDGGTTWNYSGLDLTRNTGRIAIDPQNPDRVYAATMGDLFGNNPDRGLYRTTDGGSNWQLVLSSDDSTGAIDVLVHPLNPDTVFACLWTRVRRPDRRTYGGPASGIYRSYDGGDHWTKLSTGLPSYSLGRIGIDISKSNPNILYAIMSDSLGGNSQIMKTSDNGDTWTNVSSNFVPNTYSYWYGRIKVDPIDPNTVYAIDFDLWVTYDGGGTWFQQFSVPHVDQHEIFIHPLDPSFQLLGNDGGFFVTHDAGSTFTRNEKLPIMQFYTCEMDEQNPHIYYGGAQDNGVNRSFAGANNDWYNIWGGDGFVVLVDPNDSTRVYSESQYAGINTGINGVDPGDRTNWNTPYLFNPKNSHTLYLGTEALYKSTDQGNIWNPLSGDLTNGSLAVAYPIVFATITTIAVSPADTNVIYIGTDDGNIQMTTDEGLTWNLISSSLPVRWVTHLEPDPKNAMSVYATLSGYRYHENAKHVYHTTDGGATWIDISGNLPDVPCNDLILDTTYSTLYLATDIGVFYSYTGSNLWQPLGTGLPLVPVCDLRLHQPTHKLLAATYGRSMYTFDLSILTAQEELVLPSSLSVFVLQNPVKEILNATIYSDKFCNADVSMYDATGKLISAETIALKPGTNNYSRRFSLQPRTGIYYLEVNNGGKSIVRKILFEN